MENQFAFNNQHLHCIATFTSSSWLLADKLDNSLVEILHINSSVRFFTKNYIFGCNLFVISNCK